MRDIIRSRRMTAPCKGKIYIEKGTISVDCSGCKGEKTLSNPDCFLGLSDRMIEGFQGSIVLMGEQHNHYEGAIVRAITSHSQILKEMHRLGSGRSSRKLRNISKKMIYDFKKDPGKIIERKDHYNSEIRKALREKKPPESERFISIIEATSKMIRLLERNIERNK